jgi:hypothetical protein
VDTGADSANCTALSEIVARGRACSLVGEELTIAALATRYNYLYMVRRTISQAHTCLLESRRRSHHVILLRRTQHILISLHTRPQYHPSTSHARSHSLRRRVRDSGRQAEGIGSLPTGRPRSLRARCRGQGIGTRYRTAGVLYTIMIVIIVEDQIAEIQDSDPRIQALVQVMVPAVQEIEARLRFSVRG